MSSDDTLSTKKLDSDKKAETPSVKKPKLAPAKFQRERAASESESENDLCKPENGPSPKKFTKQSVQVGSAIRRNIQS